MRYSIRDQSKYVPHPRRRIPGKVLLTAGCMFAIGLIMLVVAARVWEPSLTRSLGMSSSSGSNPPTPAPASIVSDAPSLGIAAGSSLPTLSAQQLSSRLDGIQASGARWVRLDFDWSTIQPDNAVSFNWSKYDRLVTAIDKRHVNILPILDYTPVWARPANCTSSSQCAPARSNDFAAFAAAAARRYSSSGIHYWEVWNEPNNRSFWQPSSNPAQYTSLLKATYTALHGADSHAYVLTAGLSPQSTANGAYSPYDFLNLIYINGAHGFFDGVADHPYTFPLSPAANADDAWTQMAGPTHSLRTLMLSNGDGNKKIWITEFGSPTGGPGPVATLIQPNLGAHPYVVDPALQAKILSDAIRLYHSYAWTGPFFYYTYADPGTDPSTNENFFGLVTADGTHKPAYDVFKNAATQTAN